MKKPLRVWSADRSKRYGVVAESFQNFKEKAALKLDIPLTEEIKLVLEEDGTRIDETFWETLKDHDRILALRDSEIWKPATMWPPESYRTNIDIVDGLENEKLLAEKLLLDLQQNPAILVFLNLSDMEVIKDADIDNIDSSMLNKDVARIIQDKCIDLYIQKKREDEALEIIDLIKERTQSGSKCSFAK